MCQTTENAADAMYQMRLHDDNSLTTTIITACIKELYPEQDCVQRSPSPKSVRQKIDLLTNNGDNEIHPRSSSSSVDNSVNLHAKSMQSFTAALLNNTRCRVDSISRSVSRSHDTIMEAAEMVRVGNKDEKERTFEPPLETKLQPLVVDVEQQGTRREPFNHPQYKLGDMAREEDMVGFNMTSRQRRSGRKKLRENTSTDKFTTNESDYEEFSKSWKERQINVIQQTIGQLQHLDAAFGES